MKRINLKILLQYQEEGLLYRQKHPRLPLSIWNYTEKVQYEGIWDDVTIQSRGLVTDDETGFPIVYPFQKFFNYEELVGGKMEGFQIPEKGDYVYVQEKMDGSLGILFYYGGEWIMATRGSFTSDQAIKGLELFKETYYPDSFYQEYAYLVEILYKENRIVVKYEKDRLVFLSVVLNWDFKGWKPSDYNELHWTTSFMILKSIGVKKKDIVKTEQYFSFSDELYQSLKAKNEHNKEGFVLRYQPGNFRMKIKFEEYVRLHKIMTGISTTSVWEILSSGGNIEDILKDVPDEFYVKIKEYEDNLRTEFKLLNSEYSKYFEDAQSHVSKIVGGRKEFAGIAKNHSHSSILFAMLDGRDPSPMIWKILRPEFRKL